MPASAPGLSIRNIIIGFIAAAIAVAAVHQSIVWACVQGGLIKPGVAVPWSMKPMGPLGVPTIVNSIFWGGLWGALFAVLYDKLPGGAAWLKGLIYGLLIAVFSTWLAVPLIKSQPIFANGDPMRLLAGALILGGFGIATGLLYNAMRSRD